MWEVTISLFVDRKSLGPFTEAWFKKNILNYWKQHNVAMNNWLKNNFKLFKINFDATHRFSLKFRDENPSLILHGWFF